MIKESEETVDIAIKHCPICTGVLHKYHNVRECTVCKNRFFILRTHKPKVNPAYSYEEAEVPVNEYLKEKQGSVAQLVERHVEGVSVCGSIPRGAV